MSLTPRRVRYSVFLISTHSRDALPGPGSATVNCNLRIFIIRKLLTIYCELEFYCQEACQEPSPKGLEHHL